MSIPDRADNQDAKQKTIDEAISDCRSNISRHTRAPVIEVAVALIVLLIIAFMMLQFARLQGEENDHKRSELVDNLKAVREEALRYTELYEASLADLPKSLQNLGKEQTAKNNEKLKAVLERYSQRKESAQKAVESATKELTAYKSKPIISDAMLYGAGAFLFLIIGVVSSTYRIHLKEIAKNEQYKLAFLRIRVAANNANTDGFDGEVRTALTRNAFDVKDEDSLFSRRRKVESPVPGHPTSDIAALIINRLLDEVEIVFQPKKNINQ